MSNNVDIVTIMERTVVKLHAESFLNILVKITGQAAAHEQRPPLNLSFVIDRSGSMQGAKLAYTKEALEFCIKNTLPNDVQSIVLFDQNAETLLPPGPVLNKDYAVTQVRRIYPGGTTNLSGGICRGEECLESHLDDGCVNRMIVMTDGLANQGVVEPEALLALTRRIAGRQISISTVGVGAEYDENLLQDMAVSGLGNYYYIKNPDQIPSIFAQELLELQNTAAQNLRLQIALPDGIRLIRTFGYVPQTVTDKKVDIHLPDLYSGEEKILLLQFSITASDVGILPLASLYLDYLDVSGGEKMRLEQRLEVTVSSDESLLQMGPDVEVKKNEVLFQIAEAQEEIINTADEGDFDQARAKLKAARDFTLLECAHYGFDADEALQDLEKMEFNLESAHDYTAQARKDMKSRAYNRTRRRNQ